MLVPLSWIEDFVKIKLPLKELCWKLTEVGLSVEKALKDKDETILELEVTPNRPDWLSIIGIAREIAAIQKTKIKEPTFIKYPPVGKTLPIKIVNNFTLIPRYVSVIIDNVQIKPSPLWLQDRIRKIGLRPINNMVDITNYVMFELGNPLHAFDYDLLNPKQMIVKESEGGEDFKSVDELTYKLPKGAIVLSDDGKRIIDLCGIKGGLNSGIRSTTKTVFLHAPTHNLCYKIRRTSQALSLKSDASIIFERGVDVGNAKNALLRAIELVKKYAGGRIACQIMDIKKEEFEPRKLSLSLKRTEKVLGIVIPPEQIISILENLNLSSHKKNDDLLEVTIPTFRSDLKIEEDLIEEVARHYGYNKFPQTLPAGQVPVDQVAYFKDYNFQKEIKQILIGADYSEIYTYSLVSKNQLNLLDGFLIDNCPEIINPVSLDYQFLRPTIIGNLLEALKLNEPNFDKASLFELGKIYWEEKSGFLETSVLTAVSSNDDYSTSKGVVERILEKVNLNHKDISYNPLGKNSISYFHPYKTAQILYKNRQILGYVGIIHPQILEKFKINKEVSFLKLFPDILYTLSKKTIEYKPIPFYPAIIEDITLTGKSFKTSQVVDLIYQTSSLIYKVEYLGVFEDSITVRIYYLDRKKNLTEKEVKIIREKILKNLKEELNLNLKIKN